MAPYSDAFCVASGVGQTDSQNWVREHGHSVHAALAPPSQQELYDKQRAHYTVPRTSRFVLVSYSLIFNLTSS